MKLLSVTLVVEEDGKRHEIHVENGDTIRLGYSHPQGGVLKDRSPAKMRVVYGESVSLLAKAWSNSDTTHPLLGRKLGQVVLELTHNQGIWHGRLLEDGEHEIWRSRGEDTREAVESAAANFADYQSDRVVAITPLDPTDCKAFNREYGRCLKPHGHEGHHKWEAI